MEETTPEENEALTPDATPVADEAPAPNPAAAGVSRRDFLRRAGKQAAKEAMTTGVRLVPGAAIAQTLLKTEPAETAEGEAPASPRPTLLAKLAAWKRERATPEEKKP